MRVFFGFGNAQLGQAVIGNDLSENVMQRFGAEHGFHETVMVNRVFGHTDRHGESYLFLALKAAEFLIGQSIKNFTGAVGAEVGHQNSIAVGATLIIANHAGNDEFVGNTGLIRSFNRFLNRGIAFAGSRNNVVVSGFDAVPALVAIHGVKASGQRGNTNIFHLFDRIFKIGQKTFGRRRRRVAAIQESVNLGSDAVFIKNAGQSNNMVLARMHAARRHQSHQMAGFAAGFQLFNQIGQNRIFFNAAVFDCHVNTGQVLHNDASGTQIHVADFGVAHLTVRQADGKS